MTDLTDNQVRALLKKAGPGPWDVDGPVWNRTVWRSSENRVCFMAHSNGLDDDRDIATSELVAAAPDLARALLQARADAAAAVALMVERAAEGCDDLAIGYAKHKGVPGALHDAARDIRRLAPDAGTAELAKLRGEIERLRELVSASEAQRYRVCGELLAERDTLAAELAELRALCKDKGGPGGDQTSTGP